MDVLHVDEELLVVYKPPGLLSQPDRTGDEDVLSLGRQYLAEKEGETPFLGLVHRLDRPTSGVMAMARTSEAAKILSAQFRDRVVDKRYVALVEGELRGIGTWTDYIAKPDRHPRIVSSDHPKGKRAELQWQALARGGDCTLLQIELQTGRPHQIRLQGSTRRHPVVGDVRYGAQSAFGDGAIALHHTLLRIEHPARPHRETFSVGPPEGWASVLTDSMRSAIQRMLDQANLY